MKIDDETMTGREPARADLLDALAEHRRLLLHTVRGLTDEQARQRTTVSALCLGGIVKHLCRVEESWARFVREGAGNRRPMDPSAMAAHAESFHMAPEDTLAGLVTAYEEAARSTDRLLMEVPSLDDSHSLPEAPWFEPGARWTARRVFLHVLAETSQHAGHADIIREALDGQKTMG